MAGSPESSLALKVVFDAMVFLQGLANPDGPSGQCLSLVDEGMVELYVCPSVLDEITDLLHRPKIRQKFPGMTDTSVLALLQWLGAKSTNIQEPPQQLAVDRDPKDAKYLNLAVSVGASYLITRDKDLLELPVIPAGLRILDPLEFADIVRES